MSLILALTISIVLLFGFVILFGAPFLPTLNSQTVKAVDLLDLYPGKTMLELGSGDGRVLREAASRGIVAIGYELNPILVVWSRLINRKYKALITVHWGNYWNQSLPPTDGIYVFLLQKYMTKLDKKIEQDMTTWKQQKAVKLVSFGFEIPNKSPSKSTSGLFLYNY